MDELLLEAPEPFPNFVVIDSNARVVHLNERCARLLGTAAISELLDVARLNEEIKAIRQLKESIADYADSGLTVLLTGETGASKGGKLGKLEQADGGALLLGIGRTRLYHKLRKYQIM